MYYTYIVRCDDNSLYTGITNDLIKRISAHKNKKGAKYTKNRNVIKLEIAFKTNNKSYASKLEYYIKKISKGAKEKIIKNKDISILKEKIEIENYKLTKEIEKINNEVF